MSNTNPEYDDVFKEVEEILKAGAKQSSPEGTHALISEPLILNTSKTRALNRKIEEIAEAIVVKGGFVVSLIGMGFGVGVGLTSQEPIIASWSFYLAEMSAGTAVITGGFPILKSVASKTAKSLDAPLQAS